MQKDKYFFLLEMHARQAIHDKRVNLAALFPIEISGLYRDSGLKIKITSLEQT